MSVFLRWGVFGILAVAGLMYAYNASKSLAEKRQAKVVPVVSPDDASDEDEPMEEPQVDESEPAPSDDAVQELPAACEEERLVAERALKYRRDGEPLDRLLRIEVIAFQDEVERRERLETVARHWYSREGRDPNAAALRGEVLRDCRESGSLP